jgi:hypothetical protein
MIYQKLVSLGLYSRVCPCLANESTGYHDFENKFNRERESKGLGIPFLDIMLHQK